MGSTPATRAGFMARYYFFLWCVCLLTCKREHITRQESETVKVGEEKLKKVKIIISQNAKVRTVIHAPCLYRYKIIKNQDKGYNVDMNVPVISEFNCGIEIYLLDSLDRVENSVRAKYAKYEEAIKLIHFQKQVVLGSRKGDSLWTEDLWYDNAKKKFYTDSAVRIRGKHHMIRGVGFKSKDDMSEYTIYKVHESEVKIADLQN